MGGGDHSEYSAFIRRALRAYGRRVAAADVEDLAELLAVRDAVDEAITRAVAGLRAAGRSWGEIAHATGTTRQAAQQRWGVKVALTPEPAGRLVSSEAPHVAPTTRETAAQGPSALVVAQSA